MQCNIFKCELMKDRYNWLNANAKPMSYVCSMYFLFFLLAATCVGLFALRSQWNISNSHTDTHFLLSLQRKKIRCQRKYFCNYWMSKTTNECRLAGIVQRNIVISPSEFTACDVHKSKPILFIDLQLNLWHSLWSPYECSLDCECTGHASVCMFSVVSWWIPNER